MHLVVSRMLQRDNDRGRPGERAASKLSNGDQSTLTALDDIARHVDGTFVVVVKVTGDKYLRRCYLSSKAAENAAKRATDRGETATVYLAELKPLWKLRGDE